MSVAKLESFLHNDYIMNPDMGSGDISNAIRDILTDLLHLGRKWHIDIQNRLVDASEVFELEKSDDRKKRM